MKFVCWSKTIISLARFHHRLRLQPSLHLQKLELVQCKNQQHTHHLCHQRMGPCFALQIFKQSRLATRTNCNSDKSSYKGRQPRYHCDKKQALYVFEIPLLIEQRMDPNISKLGKLLTALINPVGKVELRCEAGHSDGFFLL